jgi:hypothetical protein
MTVVSDLDAPAPGPLPAPVGDRRDHRGSWVPSGRMVTTRIMELRKRRGLMIALVLVDIGIPTIFLVIRLLTHAFDPKSYGPAGGYQIYTNLVTGVMYIFGFIVAATLGCTAGSVDLTDGMFRHLVVTGRSRMALYLARIPAGLAIVWTLLAVGFTIICAVCVFAAPTTLNYDGATPPVGLSLAGFENWAGTHPEQVICDLPSNGPGLPCLSPRQGPHEGPHNGTITTHEGTITKGFPGQNIPSSSPAQIKAQAVRIARQDYSDYRRNFLYPSDFLMIKSGLWIELEATIGFIVGLGLGSLLGQRTVAVILMIVLEIILTPLFSTHVIPHLINLQRGVVGLATAHLEPAALPPVFGNGGPNTTPLVPESVTVAVIVIVAWLVVWTLLGAWRMMTRDA